MANFIYPTEEDLRAFVSVLEESDYEIRKYLPKISEDWFVSVAIVLKYIQETSVYEPGTLYEEAARLLYKITKKHELADANKRSAVISVYLFCLLNDFGISRPHSLKVQAKRLAKSKGRKNEILLRKRVSQELKKIMYFIDTD